MIQAHAILGHERLAIVDPDSGHQQFVDEAGDLALCVNGEIYNHKEFRDGEFKGIYLLHILVIHSNDYIHYMHQTILSRRSLIVKLSCRCIRNMEWIA